jgi:hypothetical protein
MVCNFVLQLECRFVLHLPWYTPMNLGGNTRKYSAQLLRIARHLSRAAPRAGTPSRHPPPPASKIKMVLVVVCLVAIR